jgi:hypothetical protein
MNVPGRPQRAAASMIWLWTTAARPIGHAGCARPARANDLVIDERLQASAAGGDDSEFCQRKEAVEKDERGDDRQFDVKHRRNI